MPYDYDIPVMQFLTNLYCTDLENQLLYSIQRKINQFKLIENHDGDSSFIILVQELANKRDTGQYSKSTKSDFITCKQL